MQRTPSLKQRKLARNVVANIASGNPKSKRQVLKDSGYGQASADHPYQIFDRESFQVALREEMVAAGIDLKKVGEKMNYLLDGGKDGDDRVALGALKEYLKVQGAYAPSQMESKVDVDVLHRVEEDSGDYLRFLEERNQRREVIEGEVVEVD